MKTAEEQMDMVAEQYVRNVRKVNIDIAAFHDPLSFLRNVRIPIIDTLLDLVGCADGMPLSGMLPGIARLMSAVRVQGGSSALQPVDHEAPRRTPQLLHALHACLRRGTACECSDIEAVLMLSAIFWSCGIPNREVALLEARCDGDAVEARHVLEVCGSGTGLWEILDPADGEAFWGEGADRPLSACGLLMDGGRGGMPGRPGIIVTRFLACGPCAVIRLDGTDMGRRFSRHDGRNIVETLNACYREPVILGWHDGGLVLLPPMMEGPGPDAPFPEPVGHPKARG